MKRRNRTNGPPRSWLRSAAIRLIAFGVASLAGSFIVTPGEGGAKLSDAAKETAKPPAEQRTLVVGKETPRPAAEQDSPHAARETASASAGECTPQAPLWPPPLPVVSVVSLNVSRVVPYDRHPESRRPAFFDHAHVGTMIMVSSLASPDFAPATLYGLRISAGGRHTALDLALIGGRARFALGSDIAALLRDPREYGLDASVRHSVTPAYAPFGIAPTAGVRLGVLTWRYLNGIRLESDGLVWVVSGDRINHYTPYVGLAVTFLRRRHVEVATTALTGWRYYGRESNQGLENDLFRQDHLNELRLESRVLF
jgi:hypothetical protein